MIKVLVVDDSALVRKVLTEIINRFHDLQVVATANDAWQARDSVNKYKPDVITLDIEMPRMDGLSFLEKLMRAKPTPVVMISTLTEAGADATLRALELGAIDYLPKPKVGVADELEQYSLTIAEKIRTAAHARVHKLSTEPAKIRRGQTPEHAAFLKGTEKIVAIGASTGGTEAIKEVLSAFPANMPAVVITQHMPAGFTRSFAKRLNGCCAMRVKEAEHGERILPGSAYLAPGGDYHLEIRRSGANYHVHLSTAQAVNRHRPSVDVMFHSVAEHLGPNALAVILTGMGKDGAMGMGAILGAGGYTIAQDEESSLVYGMPKAAADMGFAQKIMPLQDIGPELISTVQAMGITSRV